jgi:hypothetical protein
VTEQFWPRVGQSLSVPHTALLVLQRPPTSGQLPSTVQAVAVEEHVPGTTGHSEGSAPAMWHAVAVWMLHLPAMPQSGLPVQARPSRLHVPPTAGQSARVVQAALVALQRALRTHALLSKHEARSIVHCPGWVGQTSGGQIALVIVQWPSFGHSPSAMQLLPSVLQRPGSVGQLPSTWQVAPTFALQFPYDGQSPATKQEDGTREQVPACVGHWPESVQALPTTLHVPELGQSAALAQFAPLLLHFPGGQVVIKVHAGHSSPVHGQTSGGDHAVVQVSGFGETQVGATRLQTWGLTLLHACPVILAHVCGVTPLHVCEDIPPQVCGPMPSQVCAAGGTQV